MLVEILLIENGKGCGVFDIRASPITPDIAHTHLGQHAAIPSRRLERNRPGLLSGALIVGRAHMIV